MNNPLDKLKYHVTGAIERGEKEAIECYGCKPRWNCTNRVPKEYGFGACCDDCCKALQREWEYERQEYLNNLAHHGV